MSEKIDQFPVHQSFNLVKCVTPHNHTHEKYVFIMTDKIAPTYSINGLKVAEIINGTKHALQAMPISVGMNATEDAIVEYVAVPKSGFNETWLLMLEWAKSRDLMSFMAMFWQELFVEAGNQLAVMVAMQSVPTLGGIPMELLTDELMKELFGDDSVQ